MWYVTCDTFQMYSTPHIATLKIFVYLNIIKYLVFIGMQDKFLVKITY